MRPRARRTGRSTRARVLDLTTSAAVVVLAGLPALRRLPRDVHWSQIALEGARDAALSTAPVLAVVAATRRRPATALVAAAVAVRSPSARYRRGARRTPPPDPAVPALRVVTANLLSRNRRVEDLGRQLIADGADVVLVQELTPRHAVGLRAAGLLEALPYHVLDPQPRFHGSGLLSRWPIAESTVFDVYGLGMAAATVQSPIGSVAVISVHVINPARTGMIPVWRAQLEWLAEHVGGSRIPVVLAGDFNATMDHRGIQVLTAAGLVDAHDVAGRGLGLTWPQRLHTGDGRWPALPMMRLDHVFVTPTLGVRSVRDVRSTGSDHRRLVVDLVRRSDRDPDQLARPAGPLSARGPSPSAFSLGAGS